MPSSTHRGSISSTVVLVVVVVIALILFQSLPELKEYKQLGIDALESLLVVAEVVVAIVVGVGVVLVVRVWIEIPVSSYTISVTRLG